jgi:hypothetical protein
LTLLLPYSSVHSATWFVARDGSGDFSTIQEAIEVASPGDSVLIGPGRYTEHGPFQLGATNLDTYVGVDVPNLTIKGAGADLTFVGPTTSDISGFEPRGFALDIGTTHTTLLDLTVENMHTGLFVEGERVTLENVRLLACQTGVATLGGDSCRVRACLFEECHFGVDGLVGSDGLTIVDSSFSNITGISVRIDSSSDAVIVGTTIEGGQIGIAVQQGASARIATSNLRSVGRGIGVWSASRCELIETRIDALDIGAEVGGTSSLLVGHSNRVVGDTVASIYLTANGLADFHNNDVLKGSGRLVLAEDYRIAPTFDIDLTENYWGTVDGDSLSAWIVDGGDLHNPPLDPNFSNVLFNPFLLQSVPTQVRSIGSLKSGF